MKQQVHCQHCDGGNEASTGHWDSPCTQPTRWHCVLFDVGLQDRERESDDNTYSRCANNVYKETECEEKQILLAKIFPLQAM